MLLKIFNQNLNPYITSSKINKHNSNGISFKGNAVENNAADTFISNKPDLTSRETDPNKETINWYNENAKIYFDETKDFSMKKEYPPFLAYLPKGGKILDAGCGSGRDSKEFKDMGYNVTAFDASEELTKLASEHTGLNVISTTFDKFKSDEKFDGIWACTSLLHVPKKDFEKSFLNMTDHLNSGGVLYAWLKTGTTEEFDKKGRFFNYVSRDDIEKIISKHDDLKLIKISEQENNFRKNDHNLINFVISKA
jgi:2-polyprenyl-3-methyl-5-hydroxy-6-metoxy-1,4-benzoquinol methylase